MDMEHLPARRFTLELFKSINDEPEFGHWPHKGIAYQAYMKDAEALLLLNDPNGVYADSMIETD